MIRLLIADDHHLFRQGLKRLLADHADMMVVAEAADVDQVTESVRCGEFDVAVLDLTMPGRDGLEMIAEVKAMKPGLRVLILSMHGEESYVLRALRAGADGYLTKENAAEEVVAVVRRLAAGGKYLEPDIAERVAWRLARYDNGDRPHTALSEREMKIFHMLVAGKRGGEIARELCLSEKTVSTHKAHVLRKMNMRNRTELVLYAIKHGFVAPP
ncbi:MAG TPA: response regulator transcription factor [Rhodocyclaceae bacterium]|nr:response regulator transcription factor [Rhodocyclaceae bacterium]